MSFLEFADLHPVVGIVFASYMMGTVVMVAHELRKGLRPKRPRVVEHHEEETEAP